MTHLGNENSAQSFSDRSFSESLRVVDVGAFGSWISAPKCLFFSKILSTLTEVLGRDSRANDPRMSAGCPSQKLTLWAEISFLTHIALNVAIQEEDAPPNLFLVKASYSCMSRVCSHMFLENLRWAKIANRQSLAILDRGLKSQPFSQFCCIGMFKMNRQSRVSNRSFKSQGRQRFESRVFLSLAILDLDRVISPI